MTPTSVAIVGAGLAGWRAAQTLRAEGFGGRLVLVGEEQHPPYDRPPLSKQVLAGVWPPERTVLAPLEKLHELGLELRLGRRAQSLDAATGRVELDDGTVLETDAVVVATGATPRSLPGTDPSVGALTLRTLDDAIALRQRILDAGPGCRLVVVGAGFIGSEVAATGHGLGCAVTVLEALEVPLSPALGPQMGRACASLHTDAGVELRTGVGVAAVHPGRVELADGTSVPADVVVVGIGVRPVTAWLEGSGLTLENGVVCDQALFAAERVVAAGDLARWPFWGRLVRIEHWQMASDMGVAAARALLAGRSTAPPFDPVPYFWSDQYGVKIQMLGHPEPDDEVVVVDGSVESRRFVALYGRDGHLTAALAIGRPRQLMSYRPLLQSRASWAQALAAGSS